MIIKNYYIFVQNIFEVVTILHVDVGTLVYKFI